MPRFDVITPKMFVPGASTTACTSSDQPSSVGLFGMISVDAPIGGVRLTVVRMDGRRVDRLGALAEPEVES